MGAVDKTLFTLHSGINFLLVQIYVDDIIFGGSSHALVAQFSDVMSREFEMSIGRADFLPWTSNQANQGRNLCTPDQVLQRALEEVRHGRLQANRHSHGNYFFAWS